MKTVDWERLEKHIASMRKALRLLHELADLSENEFLGDEHKQSSAKYNFTTAIEAVIDMASHIISRLGFRAPEDYADTFLILAEHNVIDRDFAAEMMKMARFRNRLVHLYWDVDVSEIYRILQTRLDDFEQLLEQIRSYLKSK